MSVPGTQGEIRALTGVRAYAAIWVMALHLPFSQGVMPHVQLGAIARHGAWGVDIFFILSGFILSLLYASRFQRGGFAGEYRRYLAARFARIYPLHLLTLAILAVYFVPRTLEGQFFPGFGLRQLAQNLSLVHGWGYAERLNWNYPSWSISCEWFAYLLLAPALVLGLRRWQPASCLLLALALWTALVLALHAIGTEVRHQTTEWGVPRILAEFTLGYALYRIHAAVKLTPRTSDGLALAGSAGIVALCFMPALAEWWLAPAAGALLLGLAQTGPVGEAIFGNRLAVFWGERSYAIYMLHALVQIFSNLVLQALDLTVLPPQGGWLLLGALVVTVLLASHLAYTAFEIPARVWLRNRLQGPAREREPPAQPEAALR